MNKKPLLVLAAFILSCVLVFAFEKQVLLANQRIVTTEAYSGIEGAESLLSLVEDFEALPIGPLPKNKGNFFQYGSAKVSVTGSWDDEYGFLSSSVAEVTWEGAEEFGGFGKGVFTQPELDAGADYVNLYVFIAEENAVNDSISIIIEEDDTGNGMLEKEKDDSFVATFYVPRKGEWQLVSLPLSSFIDDNDAGDGELNIGTDGGKLLTFIISFKASAGYKQGQKWYFDFLSFSQGPLAN